MKYYLLLTALMGSIYSHAWAGINGGLTFDEVADVISKNTSVLRQIDGVNGFGVTRCESKTGLGYEEYAEKHGKEAAESALYVFCIHLNVDSDDFKNMDEFMKSNFSEIVEDGNKLKGTNIFIHVEFLGMPSAN